MTTHISLSRSQDDLREICATMLALSKVMGATDAEASVRESETRSVSVRNGDIDVVEHEQSMSASITVHIGERSASASSSDINAASLRQIVERARDIARLTAPDPCAALPDDDLLEIAPRDLGLFTPWDLSIDAAAELAVDAEQAVRGVGSSVQCQGASARTSVSQFAALTSRGFAGGYATTNHAMQAIAQASRDGQMQMAYWNTSNRAAEQLRPARVVGRTAGMRAVAKLGARKIASRQCAVMFEAPIAAGLIFQLLFAINGTSLYREQSFLPDSIGTQVLSSHLSLDEDPFVVGGRASRPFDSDGVRVQSRRIVDGGVLQGYQLSTYSARRLGRVTTGNASGPHNLSLRSSLTSPEDDLAAMCKKMHNGLLVTGTMGDGVNPVTGDYSLGASGFWVEGGEMQHAVDEITIAGNLKQMLQGIAAVGADVYEEGILRSGSIWVDRMSVAGR